MAELDEIEALAARYGEPGRAGYEFLALSPGFRDWVRKLTRRRGETVLVIPRGEGRVLLHTKPHYPEEVYRLPTGGIRRGEEADAAARREVYEEVGFEPRELSFLAVLDNIFWLDGRQVHYPSFVFETEPFTRGPRPNDPDELISGFRDADGRELQFVARQLQSLPGPWSDWGKFRSGPHAWLAEHRNY